MTTLARLDQFARERKRAWAEGTRRAAKIARERLRSACERAGQRLWRTLSRARHERARDLSKRVQHGQRIVKVGREHGMNVAAATVNLTRKAWRRVRGLRRPFVRAGRRVERLGEQYGALREEWAVERDIESLVDGGEPILFGPWTSEVGYEALYWVAFVRWVKMTYRLRTDRLAVMSRGGVSAWYADITPRYLDIFDRVTPEAFAARTAERLVSAGTAKQMDLSAFDAELVESARRELGVERLRVMHPSLMYRLFRQFWLGHRPLGFLQSHTSFARLTMPAREVRIPDLPAEYVAVKFSGAQSLPPTPDHQRMVRRIVGAVAERYPVVLLDTGMAVDEHGDFGIVRTPRIQSVREYLRPSDNLGVQTGVIAGARGFIGTCGSVAWLAPMLGVDTQAVMTDARFLHAHLHAARWVYRTLDAGRFSPLDLGGFARFGLDVAGASELLADRPS
ncbi:MAG: hypothetical protein HY824_05120 [Acidobacteria bacterium]|nr:hypothetical protein [Acidobacteriota bacterium]